MRTVGYIEFVHRLPQMALSNPLINSATLSHYINEVNASFETKSLLLLVKRKYGDELFDICEIARFFALKCIEHEEYAMLAGRLLVVHLQSTTVEKFSLAYPDEFLNEDLSIFITENATRLDDAINHSLDFSFDYMAMCTLLRSYLMKSVDEKGIKRYVERVQFMFMRVACALHYPNVEDILETYTRLSTKQYIHASPTLYNAGIQGGKWSSCFLVSIPEDSIDGIFKSFGWCASISSGSGGIGINFTNIRAKGSRIGGTHGGETSSIVKPLQVLDAISTYVNQGGKRPGAIAAYIEPWHLDVKSFLQLKAPFTETSSSARNLFYALMVPDIFMERVEEDGKWTLFNPIDTPNLIPLFGESFTEQYITYEQDLRIPRQSIQARDLWTQILNTQQECGVPYILFKGNINRKNGQANLGTILLSNLCAEIVQYTAPDEVACCNLASISLPSCLDHSVDCKGVCSQTTECTYNFQRLISLARELTRNLNQVIDRTSYPVDEAKNSNLKHRPIAIGVQGLSDIFQTLGYPYDSKEARILNSRIFEAIYYGALQMSMELAHQNGPYESYIGSPASAGKLQHDLWSEHGNTSEIPLFLDWTTLRQDIRRYGLRNSLLTAVMPTVSTSQILGNSEACEARKSHFLLKKTQHGECVVVNHILMRKLRACGLWNTNIQKKIIEHRGSIQQIDEIPNDIKAVFRTIWELSSKSQVHMTADRGRFIDQSQSFNLHVTPFNKNVVSSILFDGFRKGLKTGSYYVRTQPMTHAEQMITCTVDCEACSA